MTTRTLTGGVLHRRTVDTYKGGSPCELAIDTDWPYECGLSDRDPNRERSIVTVCHSHHVWWAEERIEA